MSFTAHLPGLSLPDVLQILSFSKQSGIATIIHSGAAGKLVFSSGRVVYASSDTQSRLGYALVDKGVISEEDLEKALRTQKSRVDNMPLASILVKLGVVYPEVLEEETKNHIRNVFRDLLRWEDGIICFDQQEIADTLTVLREGLSIESLLLSAAASHDEDQSIDREICEFWR
ncbi:MAG: DUF4388 domain-containing protein [Planctomycetota bacterium]|nr:DUF4388 domain-containing protein [Planctomycetota bacterium]